MNTTRVVSTPQISKDIFPQIRGAKLKSHYTERISYRPELPFICIYLQSSKCLASGSRLQFDYIISYQFVQTCNTFDFFFLFLIKGDEKCN